jgi:hypothetical protein
MNKGLWIARKNYLLTLIKKLSKSHGGDSKEFLDKHFQEELENAPEERIELTIRCYEELIANAKLMSVPAAETPVNQVIVYRAPFIDPREVSHG